MSATDERALEDLVNDLARAREVGLALVGAEPIGIRPVEPSPTERHYMLAFDGPRFLILDGGWQPVSSARTAATVASAVLIVERAEDEVDVDDLHALARACGAVIAGGGVPKQIDTALQELASAALRTAAWRVRPMHVVASLAQVDTALRLHDGVRGAFAAYERDSGWLAEHQADLDAGLVTALAEIDRAAGQAHVGAPLGERLAGWMPDCDEGAKQVVAAYAVALPDSPSSGPS